MTRQTRPLDGLRVLDLSRAVSGPLAGRILSDLGADVVRAELPGTDVTQAFGKVTRGRSGLYAQVNAGKRSIVLDLHRPADVARLLDLAAACDVLVENFRPGVLDRFGAGWAALSAVNPQLVMLSVSGFGQDGDDAGRAAYAPVIHAEAGLIGRQADITGHQDRDALKRDLDTARLAWAEIRHAGDVLAAPAVAGRDAIVEVTDGDGEKRSVVRMPYRFSDAASGPLRGVPEPGEHTDDILRDWTSRAD
jgi:crotonobetainyl-CoA:carnitine CoA-transferase CaiB-like acyl-CoA transferase